MRKPNPLVISEPERRGGYKLGLLLVEQACAKKVADVRAQRINRAAVNLESDSRVGTLLVFDPEPLPELLREARGELPAIASAVAEGVAHLRAAHCCLVGVALNLAQREWSGGVPSVAKLDRVVRVLQPWLVRPWPDSST